MTSGHIFGHKPASFGLLCLLRLFELGFAIGRDASRLCCSPAFLASCGGRLPARLRDPHAGTSIGCRPATVRLARAVASPALLRSPTMSTVKPCATITASVQP